MKKQPFEVALNLPIKTYDIDFAGIVSNIVYIRWLEDLRLKMLESHFPIEKLMSKGYCPTVNSTEIKYQKALRLGDRVMGKMWIGAFTLYCTSRNLSGTRNSCYCNSSGIFYECRNYASNGYARRI
jgi:acyl-CoA thioester hydrolase